MFRHGHALHRPGSRPRRAQDPAATLAVALLASALSLLQPVSAIAQNPGGIWGSTLSREEREEINIVLTCDDCAPDVIPGIADLGWRAIPRLEGALEGPHSSRVEVVRQNASHAYSLIRSPAIDSAQFAETAVSAYRDAYQARAAIALARIAERNTVPGCFLRQLWPPVTCWEQAEDALEGALNNSAAYSPPVLAVINEQYTVIQNQGHWWTGYKIFGVTLGVVAATVIVLLAS